MNDQLHRAGSHLARLRQLLGSRNQSWDWASEGYTVCGDLTTDLGTAGMSQVQPVCQALRHLFRQVSLTGPESANDTVLAMSKLLQFIESQMKTGAAVPARTSSVPPASFAPSPSLSMAPRRGSWSNEETVRMVNETRLGELLLQAGRIDDETLGKALELQQVGAKRLGDVLVGMGKIRTEELDLVLEQQRELTLRLAGKWRG
jgi:hypothetical protein